MSVVSTDCEACAFRSSIVLLYAVIAVPEYALQPGSDELSSRGAMTTPPTATTASTPAPATSALFLAADDFGGWSPSAFGPAPGPFDRLMAAMPAAGVSAPSRAQASVMRRRTAGPPGPPGPKRWSKPGCCGPASGGAPGNCCPPANG